MGKTTAPGPLALIAVSNPTVAENHALSPSVTQPIGKLLATVV